MQDIHRWYAYCFKIFYSHGFGPEQAEEYCQDAMVRLLDHLEDVDDIKTYLIAVCMNIMRHAHREQVKFRNMAPKKYFEKTHSPSTVDLLMAEEDPTAEALATLTPGERRALSYYLERGSTNGRAVAGTRMSANDRGALYRARQKLMADPRIQSLRD